MKQLTTSKQVYETDGINQGVSNVRRNSKSDGKKEVVPEMQVTENDGKKDAFAVKHATRNDGKKEVVSEKQVPKIDGKRRNVAAHVKQVPKIDGQKREEEESCDHSPLSIEVETPPNLQFVEVPKPISTPLTVPPTADATMPTNPVTPPVKDRMRMTMVQSPPLAFVADQFNFASTLKRKLESVEVLPLSEGPLSSPGNPRENLNDFPPPSTSKLQLSEGPLSSSDEDEGEKNSRSGGKKLPESTSFRGGGNKGKSSRADVDVP